MSIQIGIEDFSVNYFEYGFLTEDTDADAEAFKLYIPKLMPTYPRTEPSEINWAFNNVIFINDVDCLPRSSSRITTQNYVTVPRYASRNFSARADENGKIPKGTRFIVQIMDNNLRDMHISDMV